MPSPAIIPCPADQWALVAVGAKGGRINRVLTNPNKYSWTYRVTGDTVTPAPTSAAEGVPIFDDKKYLQLPPSSGINVYIYAYDSDGSVRADILTEEADVNLQDQDTPVIIEKFNQVHDSTTLAINSVKYEYTITVDDPTGIVVGSHLILFSVALVRFASFTALGVAGSVISLDSQLPVAFPSGTFVDIAITEMSVDGSVTPQIFGIRGTGVIPGIEIKADITRVLITCFTATPVSLALFGDLARLTRGLALRFRNDTTFNIFNVKDNGEIAGITLDWIPYSKSKPNEGQDGFTARLTFNGQNKIGVVERLAAGEDLEFIVQDNLLGIVALSAVAEGHIVED